MSVPAVVFIIFLVGSSGYFSFKNFEIAYPIKNDDSWVLKFKEIHVPGSNSEICVASQSMEIILIFCSLNFCW